MRHIRGLSVKKECRKSAIPCVATIVCEYTYDSLGNPTQVCHNTKLEGFLTLATLFLK